MSTTRFGTTAAASTNAGFRSSAAAAEETATSTMIAARRNIPRSIIEPRHRADRRAGAALDLQRNADETEAALADQLVEVDQPLHVGEAEIAADVVDLEI